PPSLDYISGPEEPQTPPAPQDEDVHEPMFIQPYDPDFVPKPIYPEEQSLSYHHPPLTLLPVELGLPFDFRYEVEESSTARPIRGQRIEDTWIDPVETVPEISPMTMGEVNTGVTELAELHEHDTQDLYALLEDA
nr:hypothetical protein [Tanacetum cinerariifolium]